jgi:diguanylate cyclase (GGDEF)-like protein
VSPSRLRKRIARALVVSWREQPTRYDIEALQTNIRRVGLVIQLRWALLVVLVLYSAFAGLAYALRMTPEELVTRMAIPAIALGGVVLYNAFYQFNYKRLGNISLWNHLQLALDALVVTVLVYFSGAVNSWFWSMYSLFILEAAFILPRRRDAWLLTALCVGLLGGMEWLEFAGVIPHVSMPFAAASLHYDPVFVVVSFGWQVAVLAGTAAVSARLVGAQHREVSERSQLAVFDEATGLYSRAYFLRALSVEVRRAQRDDRPLHVLLIDIDCFGDFNRRFGFEVGDRLLCSIAGTITTAVGEAGDVLMTTNLAARFGGEEFVVLLAEDAQVTGPPMHGDAMRMAERLRREISACRESGAGVTVSIGVTSFPTDGVSADDLLDAADAALSEAVELGGDRVAQTRRPAAVDAAEHLRDAGIEPLGDAYRDSLED